MRQHPLVGERILRSSPAFRSVAAIVRSTHEHWNGSGYPDGLEGEKIPLPARIIAVCEAYVAMTSERPYRSALTPELALAELESGAGTQFDPTVVRVLTAHVRDRLEAERAA
jgi:HD-GYP domain-containing protein (c-di-GMP phosphodiesterase class II)